MSSAVAIHRPMEEPGDRLVDTTPTEEVQIRVVSPKRDALRMWHEVMALLSQYESDCGSEDKLSCADPYHPEHED